MQESGAATRWGGASYVLASCVCDGWTPQNAAHLYECPWVGDGKGRTRETILKDEKWCEDLTRFVM